MAQSAAGEPVPRITGNLLKWEELDSFLTPADEFFYVQHYGRPDGLDAANWRVAIEGLVAHPQSLALEDIKAHPLHEVDFTLECSGNADTSEDFFFGGVGTARWVARGWPRSSRRRASWTKRPRSCSGELIAAR